MSDTEEKASFGGWGIAIAASLAIHCLVLWLLVSGGESRPGEESGGETTTAAETPRPAEAESTGGRVLQPSPAEPSEILTPSARPAGETAQAAPQGGAQRPAPPVQAATAAAAEGEDGVPAEYVVKQGDTITKIAKRYGLSPEEIARANNKPLSRLNNIWVGQKLKLK